MRRVSGGHGKATPNADAEPDFDDIEKKYPLRPAEDPQPQGKGKVVVKKAEVHFHDYDHGPLNFLGDSDLGKEASTSKNKEDAPLMLLARRHMQARARKTRKRPFLITRRLISWVTST